VLSVTAGTLEVVLSVTASTLEVVLSVTASTLEVVLSVTAGTHTNSVTLFWVIWTLFETIRLL
jgi:hypothetical protein